MLAAAPSTAVQLTHACTAAGFDTVIPASWGDELIAAHVDRQLDSAVGPVLQCSCPLVAQRLTEHGDALAPMTVCTVSPPAATAAYLRAVYAPERPHITYVGACRGAYTDAIDVVLSPAELFAMLDERGVQLAAQPPEFDAMLAPDRRRFHSDPGGVPCISALRRRSAIDYAEVTADGFVTELAQYLLEQRVLLVDASGAVGCACCGAVAGPESARLARARVCEHEPPRAPGPVLDESLGVSLGAELPRPGRIDEGSAVAGPEGESARAEPVAVVTEVPRRRSPIATRKSVLGVMPQTRAEAGRQLPRAYVARRRSSPKGVPAQRQPAASTPALRAHWPYVAFAGVAVGLGLAWLVGLLR